jgi:transcriptional regulator with XRE-family HTH domain
MTAPTVAALFRAARNGLSQKEFALQLGVEQSTISRYENGTANPPAKVIDRCMHLVHSRGEANAPSADELAAKVRSSLADTQHGPLRHALDALIDTLASGNGGLAVQASSRDSLEK